MADFYHKDADPDWIGLKKQGVVAVFLKASQGTDFPDPTYLRRHKASEDAGLLTGAYHFLTPGDVTRQVEFFLHCVSAQPNGIRYALDWEKDEGGHFAGMWAALKFLEAIKRTTGQTMWLYGGELLRGRTVPPAFGEFPLWLSEYGPIAKVPLPWKRYTLWQYTERGEIASDLSTYEVTDDEFRKMWMDTVTTESV